MEFLKELVSYEGVVQVGDSLYQHFNHIKVGNVNLSIQGSQGHYCSPRETINPKEYMSMEMAVIVDGEWVNLENDHLFDDFDKVEDFKIYEGGTEGLYGFIPVELIEDLYQYLKFKSE